MVQPCRFSLDDIDVIDETSLWTSAGETSPFSGGYVSDANGTVARSLFSPPGILMYYVCCVTKAYVDWCYIADFNCDQIDGFKF